MTRWSQSFWIFLPFIASYILGGCGKQNSKYNQISNPTLDTGLDIAGEYTSKTENGSEVSLEILIENQTDLRDIEVTVNRLTPMTNKERDFLVERKISPSQVQDLFSGEKMVMGEGQSSAENNPNADSSSSRFEVCTPIKKLEDGRPIQYCLTGKATDESPVLLGELLLVLKEFNNQKEASLGLSYRTDVGKPTRVDLAGLWSGEITALDPDFIQMPFKELNIEKGEDGTLTVAPSQEDFDYQGESYELIAEESQLQILYAPDKVTSYFTLIYRSSRLKRIVFQGIFNSMETMSGSFWYNERRRSQSLGLLKFTQ